MDSKLDYKHRWKLVYASFILQFCSLYAFQDFSTNHDYIKGYFSTVMDGADFEFYFNMIYSISLCLLIVFAIQVGVYCDKYGSSVVILVQWMCMLVGAIFMTYSIYYHQFVLLGIGRTFIFMANSTMWISLGTFIQQFFNTQEQSTPQAIMTTAILALFFNLNTAPAIVQSHSILFQQFVILGLTIISTVISIIVYNIDRDLDDQLGNSNRDKKPFKIVEFFQEFQQYPKAFYSYMCQNFLSLIVSTIIEIVGPAFLTSYWDKTPEVAARICSVAPLCSVSLVILGKIADKFKKHTQLMILASALHIVAMVSMPLLPDPIISFIIYGFAFSIRMMLTFPVQSLLVPKKSSGKIYAVTRASKDVFGFMIAFINGWIASNWGYGPVIYIQAGISVLVTFFAISLHKQYYEMLDNKDPYLKRLDKLNNQEIQDTDDDISISGKNLDFNPHRNRTACSYNDKI